MLIAASRNLQAWLPQMQVLDATQYRAHLNHPPAASDPLLCVSDLTVNFRLDQARESAVLRQVNFAIAPGKIIGLLGESGCGKTTTALSILRLLAPAARTVSGSIQFRGNDLLQVKERRLREIRGAEISIVYQDSNVLNPVMRVGDQVMEVLRAHKPAPCARMRAEILELFAAIGLDDHERIYRAYPHQLSGGQRRRIVIAQALICQPQLVIADEPTAGLDSETSAGILQLVTRLRDLYGTAFLLITHDPEALAAVADDVLVMYTGQIVESGPVREVFSRPLHPYTHALLQCGSHAFTAEKVPGRRIVLPCIPGYAPDPSESLSGCSFAGRCSDRMAICDSKQPVLFEISAAQSARCFKHEVEA